MGRMLKSPLIVVAGVIERDARILICRRRADARHHPLKWEFPGGKVEPGEEPRAALARELGEELGIRAEIGEEIESFAYQYAGPRSDPADVLPRVSSLQAKW